jgi:predicted MFS family arabinose efflux permease
MFQGRHFGSINGFLVLGFGLGGIIGPWFGGFVFDTTKNYSTAFIVAILVTCVAFVLLWIAAPRKIRKLA